MTLDELEKPGECAVAICEHTEDAQVYVVATREILAECKDADRARLICAALNALLRSTK